MCGRLCLSHSMAQGDGRKIHNAMCHHTRLRLSYGCMWPYSQAQATSSSRPTQPGSRSQLPAITHRHERSLSALTQPVTHGHTQGYSHRYAGVIRRDTRNHVTSSTPWAGMGPQRPCHPPSGLHAGTLTWPRKRHLLMSQDFPSERSTLVPSRAYTHTHTHAHTHTHTHTRTHTQQPLLPRQFHAGWRREGQKLTAPAPWSSLPPPPTCPAPPLALLSAVRINGDGQEILYLAEGDNVRLGCPYILDPEDYGPNGLDIEWMQVNSDPSQIGRAHV